MEINPLQAGFYMFEQNAIWTCNVHTKGVAEVATLLKKSKENQNRYMLHNLLLLNTNNAIFFEQNKRLIYFLSFLLCTTIKR